MERAEVPGMIREQRLSRWIEEYSDSILHTCFLYLSDQGQAEDATQDIGDHVIIGYLGVSELYDEYTLAVYENPLGNPLEFVTVKVQYENNLTWTPEERVWQQGSDRTKPHNEADDTLVNWKRIPKSV